MQFDLEYTPSGGLKAAAIDDISFSDCDPTEPSEVSITCDFETDFCSWLQLANADLAQWNRRQTGNWYEGTGPGYDHTTSDGFYVYFSSHGLQAGDLAVL